MMGESFLGFPQFANAMQALGISGAQPQQQRTGMTLNPQLESPGPAAAAAALIPGRGMPQQDWSWASKPDVPFTGIQGTNTPPQVAYGSSGWEQLGGTLPEAYPPSEQAEPPNMPSAQRKQIAGKEAGEYKESDLVGMGQQWISQAEASPSSLDLNPPANLVSDDSSSRLEALITRNNHLVEMQNKVSDAFKAKTISEVAGNKLLSSLNGESDAINKEQDALRTQMLKEMKASIQRLGGKYRM